MKFQSLLAAVAITSCLSAPVHATEVLGTITDVNSFNSYMGIMDDIVTSPVTGLLPSSAFVFCVQGSNHWPGVGARDTYTLGDSFAPYIRGGGDAGQATSILHYVVDNYYPALMAGTFGPLTGYGFSKAIWQVTDFDGQQSSMQVYADPELLSEAPDSYALYAKIMSDVYSHYGTIVGSNYRSTSFDIVFLQDHDTDAQSLALINPITAVPEPSSVALMVAGGLGILLRAKRRKSGA